MSNEQTAQPIERIKKLRRNAIEVRVSGDLLHDVTAATELVSDICSKIEAECTPVDLIIWIDGEWGARSWPNEVTVQDITRWERSLRRLELIDAVVITVVSGVCGGPEFELALAGNYCVASSKAEMRPPLNNELYWPGTSIYRLVDRCGVARARQIILGGKPIAATQCVQFGIVDEVTDDPNSTVEQIRARAQSPRELSVRRRLITEAAVTPYEEIVGTLLAACDRELRRLYPNEY